MESMRQVQVGRVKFVQDTNKELIKVNGDNHESNRVNVVFDILHVFYNGPSALLSTIKILKMDHDSFAGGRGICLLKGGLHSPRCGEGGKKLHKRGRDGSDNCIKKQLILS